MLKREPWPQPLSLTFTHIYTYIHTHYVRITFHHVNPTSNFKAHPYSAGMSTNRTKNSGWTGANINQIRSIAVHTLPAPDISVETINKMAWKILVDFVIAWNNKWMAHTEIKAAEMKIKVGGSSQSSQRSFITRFGVCQQPGLYHCL